MSTRPTSADQPSLGGVAKLQAKPSALHLGNEAALLQPLRCPYSCYFGDVQRHDPQREKHARSSAYWYRLWPPPEMKPRRWVVASRLYTCRCHQAGVVSTKPFTRRLGGYQAFACPLRRLGCGF